MAFSWFHKSKVFWARLGRLHAQGWAQVPQVGFPTGLRPQVVELGLLGLPHMGLPSRRLTEAHSEGAGRLPGAGPLMPNRTHSIASTPSR